MANPNTKKEKEPKRSPGFFKRHWKGITAGVTALVGLGVGLYLYFRGQEDDATTADLPLPDINKLPLSEIQFDDITEPDISGEVELPDTVTTSTRSYAWREEGHDVTGHVRHYRNGTETYVHPYYKPTGCNNDEAA